MNRRRFLQLFGLSVAAVVVAPALPAIAVEATEPAAVGLEALPYWQVNAHSGTFAGIDRAVYPGRLSTPTLNCDGAALTPEVVRNAVSKFQMYYLPDGAEMPPPTIAGKVGTPEQMHRPWLQMGEGRGC